MHSRLRANLTLMRPANVCTAIADVIAGAAFMGTELGDWRFWIAPAGASALLYAGGVVLNDVCDAKRDAVDRPERPIPAGLASRGGALILACMLLLGGVALAGLRSRMAVQIAGGLLAAIILYNVVFKSTMLGPVMMGLCRALNLGLGFSANPMYHPPNVIVAVMGLMWLYVASITLLARDEHTTSPRGRVRLAAAGLGCAAGGLAGVMVLVPESDRTYLVGVAGLLVVLVMRMTPPLRDPSSHNVRRAVGGLVLSLVWFDACLAWSAGGVLMGLAIAALMVPSRLLVRAFPVT